MWESTLRQTLDVQVASDIQKINSSDWPKWCFALLHKCLPFVGPNIISNSSTNRLSIHHQLFFKQKQLSHLAIPSECAAVVFELKNRPSPRSPSLTTPCAVMKTLAGLMSRCMIRRECMWLRALQIWMKYFHIVFSGIRRSCRLKCCRTEDEMQNH